MSGIAIEPGSQELDSSDGEGLVEGSAGPVRRYGLPARAEIEAFRHRVASASSSFRPLHPLCPRLRFRLSTALPCLCRPTAAATSSKNRSGDRMKIERNGWLRCAARNSYGVNVSRLRSRLR